MKSIILLFLAIGSGIGSYLPVFWGASILSGSSILFGAIGGFVGIWIGYRVASGMGIS